MLGGRVAREVFEEDRIRLPDRRVFMEEVNRTERELHDAATTRAETDSAWRRAVEGVLLARVLRFIFDGRKAYDTFRHGNGSGDNVRKVRS